MHLKFLLVVVCVAALGSAESPKEVNAEESVRMYGRLEDQDYNKHIDHRDKYQSDIIRHSPSGPHDQDDIAYQRIIDEVYSPDYAEPQLILDYRYMKSGGRDYVRGPGGQIIILPKGRKNDEPKEFPDYDSLIEHLRIKNQGKAYRQEDVALNSERDGHRPRYNVHDDGSYRRPRVDVYVEHPVHENSRHYG